MRILRAAVNILLLLTGPLWFGFMIWFALVKDPPLEELRGEKWLFD